MSGLQRLQGQATGQVMQLASITLLELSKPRQVSTCGYSIMADYGGEKSLYQSGTKSWSCSRRVQSFVPPANCHGHLIGFDTRTAVRFCLCPQTLLQHQF